MSASGPSGVVDEPAGAASVAIPLDLLNRALQAVEHSVFPSRNVPMPSAPIPLFVDLERLRDAHVAEFCIVTDGHCAHWWDDVAPCCRCGDDTDAGQSDAAPGRLPGENAQEPRCPEHSVPGTLAAVEGGVWLYVCPRGHDWTVPVKQPSGSSPQPDNAPSNSERATS